MKRADINRISAEKQQMILDYMRDAGKPMSVKEIFEALPLSRNDIRTQFGNLKVKKAIERTERGPHGYEYVIANGKEPKKGNENCLDGTGTKSEKRDQSRGCLLLHTRRWRERNEQG